MEEPLYGLTLDGKLDRIAEMLRAIADDEPATRRRLHELRSSPGYADPFEADDPLVSIVIPTYTSVDTLRDVSIPSALAQTHANVEVVVVGDAAPPETAAAVEAFGDERVRFENLSVRGPYPDDPDRAWLVVGTPPLNAGIAAARGAWIAPLGDDDALRPNHVADLLAAARERRLELVYSPLRAHLADGSEVMVGEFPPRLGEFGLQGALYHAGLRFMELNLADEIFDVPNDWSLCRRMLRAGVRVGMHDESTVDYYPSREWGRRERARPRTPAVEPPTHEQLNAERARANAAEAGLAAANERLAEVEQRLAIVTGSNSWRLTEPLRAAGRQLRDRRSR